MKYYLIAGEASGDLHASNLMSALKEQDPQAQFRFLGGDMMQAQGGELVRHYREMAYMGFIQVIRHLPSILGLMKTCTDDIKAYQPDVVILIDYPSFNLKVARFVKEQLGIPVYYYISPKIWAWKEYRIHQIKKYIDRMYCILPFEVAYYRKHDYQVQYVGNPSVDELTDRIKNIKPNPHSLSKDEPSNKRIVSLLAGSRKAEVASSLPRMLQAMEVFPDCEAIIAGAPGLDYAFYEKVLDGRKVKVVFGQTYDLLAQSQAALVTSGTATLETALLNVPQVVCYHVAGGRLFYKLMSHVLKVPYVSLVNLIADEPVVPELLGYRFTAESAAEELAKILDEGEARRQMLEGYERMRSALGGPGAAQRAAKAIIETLQNR